MSKKEAISSLMDHKKAAILRILLNSKEELYLKEISQQSSVPIASTFRILQELVSLGLIEKRKWKTTTVYSCLRNEKVDFLQEIFLEEYDGVREFTQKVEKVSGIHTIILHNPGKKGGAHFLL